MTANPFSDAKQTIERTMGTFSLSLARVADVPDNVQHQIKITPITETAGDATISQPTTATVAVSQHGDIALPKSGDVVIVGQLQNQQPIILDVLYMAEDRLREYSRDERHIANEDISVYIHGTYMAPPSRTDDPDTPPSSAIWYRSDLNEYRGVEGGQIVSFDTTDV